VFRPTERNEGDEGILSGRRGGAGGKKNVVVNRETKKPKRGRTSETGATEEGGTEENYLRERGRRVTGGLGEGIGFETVK